MPRYTARPEARSYGHAIGIIVLDCVQPNIPGDVANASTYRYPVLFESAPGLTPTAAKTGDATLRPAAVEAARRLAGRGVKAITSNCGFLLLAQEEVASAVEVPVMMSSLMQAPMMCAALPPGHAVGVVTADSRLMTDELASKAAGPYADRLRVTGMESSAEFQRAFLEEGGILDSDRLEEEVVEITRELIGSHPEIGAVLLECALLPPYSHRVQQATGLPVCDFVTLTDWLFASTHQQRYAGHY